MDVKKVAIWVLSILLLIALVVITIMVVKARKEAKKSPLDKLKDYVSTLPVYATNDDAIEAGLKAGDRYRTSQTAETFSIVVAP